MPQPKAYQTIISEIFKNHYVSGITEFYFEREEIKETAKKFQVKLPANLGDVIYSFRFRTKFPSEILVTAPEGYEWRIQGAGRGIYKFRMSRVNRIIPNLSLIKIKIPDSTPEILIKYTSGDEQALLTKVRYNRLIDIFLGLTTYSLQNHLRSNVKLIGQIEIDEIYVGLDRQGKHFIIPVQAKAGSDQIGVVQTEQDIAYCSNKFSDLICRPIATQFLGDDLIAMFELTIQDNEIRVVDEKHYQLVSGEQITNEDLQLYRTHG